MSVWLFDCLNDCLFVCLIDCLFDCSSGRSGDCFEWLFDVVVRLNVCLVFRVEGLISCLNCLFGWLFG